VIAYEMAAKSAPDGYTLIQATPSFALNTLIFRKLPYSIKDFTPITNIAQGFGYLLLVHPSVPATSIKELIALAKNKDKPLAYGTPGVGNTLHLATELFNARAETNMLHVPYKGGAPAMAISAARSRSGHSRRQVAGQGRKVAGTRFTGAKRWDGMPNIPTISNPRFLVRSALHGMRGMRRRKHAIVLRCRAGAQGLQSCSGFFRGWRMGASAVRRALRAYVDAELKDILERCSSQNTA
jgi:hypothetical protein